MPVEVLVGHVGDSRHVIINLRDARLIKGMGGRFNNRRLATCLNHLSEVPLQVKSLGGGDMKACVESLRANTRRNGRNQAGPQTMGAKDTMDEGARRGLSIGAGHAHNDHLVAGEVEKGGGQEGKCLAAICYLPIGNIVKQRLWQVLYR